MIGVRGDRRTLLAPAFRPLRLGTLRPTGWLRRQLEIQAAGLSGNLDLFWPDVADSRWFGGTSEAWERAPYWLDGVIPLAWLLADSPLRARVSERVEQVLRGQHGDGWLGPREMVVHAGAEATANYDLWGQILVLKALLQHHEASGDGRAAAAIERNLACIARHIDRQPLFGWGQFRWFETLIPLQWCYERSGEPWLLDLAATLAAQGFDYAGFFRRWPFSEPPARGRWTFASHVVNNAMAIKAHGLWWRHTAEASDRAAGYDLIDRLDRHHGMPTGVFSGDECLAGPSPVRGTELCAVMEYAYSLECLLGLLGDPLLADRLERIAFNAIPATFAPDMWSHQYDQQVNQVECSVREGRTWGTNPPDSNIFGLEPSYGCCTANLSQGWPKLAAHLWMGIADGGSGFAGLAASVYAPCELEAMVRGVRVTVATETGYPFRDAVAVRVRCASPVSFPILFRIPGWCAAAEVRIGEEVARPAAGTFHRIERAWGASTEVNLRFPMAPALRTGYRGAVSLERGPLLYALRVGEDWRRIHEELPHRELPHADWEVHPTTPWNYALELAPDCGGVVFSEHPIADVPFSPESPPVVARVAGRRLPQWGMENGSAAEVPEGSISSSEPREELAFIPYGCTNLRVAELPLLGPNRGASSG